MWGTGKLITGGNLAMESLTSRNAGGDENGRFDEISAVNLTIFCKLHGQRWARRVGECGDFYANYVLANLTITGDGSNVLANLAILAIFM